MRSSSRVGRRSLAFLTALATALALAVPLMGTAGATHGAGADPTQVTLSPDTAGPVPSGTCVSFTVTATSGGQPAEGETIDVSAILNDDDGTAGPTGEIQEAVAFCDPDGSGAGTNLAGLQGASGVTPYCDLDDSGTSTQNDGVATNALGENCNEGASGAVGEAPGVIHDEGFTNQNGQFTFGVRANSNNGTVTVTAWFDENADDPTTPGAAIEQAQPDADEPFDTSTLTLGQGGAEAVENISCTPETDTNPEGSRHEFTCTTTNAQGQPVSGVNVTFDVTAGPNAEEVGPTNCGAATNTASGGTATDQQGRTSAATTNGTNSNACGYTDSTDTLSPPGTDTITAYVNQAAGPGDPAPTSGPQAGEPQTTITKSWTGQARTIDCTPEDATNPVGTTHTITCTVTDINGQPVSGVEVTFSKRSCPGELPTDKTETTDANGQVTIQIFTDLNAPTGTSVVRGEITNPNEARTECARTPATGETAGVCFDDVTKTWTRGGQTTEPPPPPPNEAEFDRDITINFRHIRVPGPGGALRRQLVVSGEITATRVEGSTGGNEGNCANRVRVKVQIRASGEWITRKSDTTNQNGRYKVVIFDAPARYRTVAPRTEVNDLESNTEHLCQRAAAKRHHGHRRS